MKFEKIKGNDLFGAFEKEKISNLNAICGGVKSETNDNAASVAAGKSGADCHDTNNGNPVVTDDGHCRTRSGGGDGMD